jgi:PAS domain S-box-containing protein
MVDRFQHLFDSLTEEVVVVDRELRISYANPAWMRRFGLEPSEVLGRRCHRLLLRADAPCALEICGAQQVFQTGRPAQVMENVCGAHGSGAHRELTASPVFEDSRFVKEVIQILHPPRSESPFPGIRAGECGDGQGILVEAPLSDSGQERQAPFDALLDQLGRVVDYDRASIALLDNNQWRIAASRGLGSRPGPGLPLLMEGGAMLGSLSARGEPLFFSDIEREPDLHLSEVRDGTRSWLAAPLLCQGQVIGTLNLYKDIPAFFSPADSVIAMAFANQAAMILDNARLLEAERARTAQLRLLGDLSQRVLSILNPESLLEYATRAIQSQFGYYHVDVFLTDDDSDHVRFQASSDTENAERWRNEGLRFRIGQEGIIGHVAATGQPHLVRDVSKDERYLGDILLPETRSELTVPIQVGSRLIGVLDLNSNQLDAFDDDDLFVAQSLADQLALALENARLYESARQRVAELEALRRASIGLTSSLELEDVLEAILETTVTLMSGVQDAHIFLYQDDLLSFGAALWADGQRRTAWAAPRPEGLTYTVAHSGEPVYVPDMRSHPLFEDTPPDWTGAIVGLPLRFGERVVGVMSIAYNEPRPLPEDELQILRLIADQAAVAIENARLYEQVSHHLEEVQILNKVATAATSTLDFDQVIRRSMEALLGLRHFQRANILLLDENTQELWLHPALADCTTFPQRANVRIPLGKGITGSVAQTGTPRRVGDVRQLSNYIEGYADTRSELCVPLRLGERTVGVLDVQSTRPDAFSEDDERLLTTLAGHLSTLLENSRLFAETQHRVRELSSLMQVSQALNEAEDMDTALSIVLEKAFTLTNSSEGSIILIDPPGSKRLRIVAERGLGPEVVEAFNSRPVYTHEGTYKRALRSGRIIEIHDTASDPDFLHDVGSRAKTVTNVPLITERGPIGLIAVDGICRDGTTRQLLSTLASMAAVAIDKERLHLETANRLAEVSTLYTLSTQITTSLSMRSVIESIVAILRLTLDCRSCSIFLLDATGKYLQLEAGSGPSETWKGIARLQLGEGVSGRVIAERHAIYVPDTHEDPDFIFFNPQIRSLLVVPLIIRNKAIGTLSIDDTRPNAFDDEMRLLSIAAAQAAVAIENAQLYESLERSYNELEQAYEELRQLDKMKSELIQNISHELRTPLTFIKGYVELLQDGEMGALQENQQMALNIVADKAEVLSKLVDDIISMQQAGREQLQFEPLSLAEIGHAAVKAALANAKATGVTLVDDIDIDSAPVLGDRRRLGQVFDNLLQNAIKFTPPDGTATVRMRQERGSIRVEVEDSGIGIAADQLDRIFERFYQVDGTTTRRFGGAGLGLAIVKQIVEAHGGSVGAESELHQGSLFYFTIPVAETAQP